ncbi:MAG: hypothetical protein K1Y01_08455 [Vicinamibacteria bacterium]|nr:hypothetical protein [Vicinamibacteria bacterium]
MRAFRAAIFVVVAWAMAASPALGQTSTALVFNSQPNEFLGKGKRWTYSPLDGDVSVWKSGKTVAIQFMKNQQAPGDGALWIFFFTAPNDAELAPGTYDNAVAWPYEWPNNDTSRPAMDVTNGNDCSNSATGRFVVQELSFAPDGSIETLAIDYEFHCFGFAPALFGAIRINYATSPHQISSYAGDNQIAPIGSSVPVPPSVVVRDSFDVPVPGVQVTFAVGSGGGSVAGGAQITNIAGIAAPDSWFLGPIQGVSNNTLTASSLGLAGSPVTFTASASAEAPPSILDSTGALVSAGDLHTCAVTSLGGVRCWGLTSLTNSPGPSWDVPGAGGAVSVTAGSRHTCSLTSVGGVKCWGQNWAGQLGDGTNSLSRQSADFVSGLTSGVAAVATGPEASHTCALTAAGGVWCWGFNDSGQLGDGTTTNRYTPVSVPGLASGVAAISTGASHTCALTLSGAVKCWGRNSNGQLGDGTNIDRTSPVDVLGLSSGAIGIAAGLDHTCALTTGGGAKCWGNNSSGALGDGTNVSGNSPADVSGLSAGLIRLSAANGRTCALTVAGGVKCWGRNTDGQLGDGTTTNRTLPVAPLEMRSGVVSVSAGKSHTCIGMREGGLRCVGANANEQLGDGTTTKRVAAVVVGGLSTGMAQVSLGLFHSCGLTTGGGTKCWGNNYDGEVGDGTTTDRTTPTDVFGLSQDVKAVAVGAYHSCALTTGGAVRCWGYNGIGGLGDGTTTSRTTPVEPLGLGSGITQVATGLYHSCALTANGIVKCWGNNGNGQLGIGNTISYPTPQIVAGLGSPVASIAAGDFHTCALTSSGGVKCWGSNLNGKLGDGTTVQRLAPVDVLGLTGGVTNIAASSQNTCAVTVGGALKCWGANNGGQLGDGTTTPRGTPGDVLGLSSGVVAVTTGKFHACAVTSGAALKCWGWNSDGQLGDGTLAQQTTPVDVPGLTDTAARVSAGGYHTCAITTGGGLECWGYNGYGGVGDGTTNTRSTPRAIQLGQSIAFPVPAVLAKGIPTTLVATSTSGLPVTFETWTPTTCVVLGNRVTVTAPASALCGIKVSQSGNSSYSAAPQQIHLIPTIPSMTIGNASVLEGATGTTTASFAVTLSGGSANPVSASFATSDLSATSGVDYTPTSGTITFAPGEVAKVIDVEVLGDTSTEPADYFKVTLSALSGAGAGTLEALGAIIDDDNPDPTLIGISSVRGPEGYLAGSTLAFPVRLSRPATAPVTVNYATSAGTAAAGSDFTAAAGQITFNLGDIEKFVLVPVLGDAISEPNETLTVTLSSPTGATFLPGGEVATGTILNDDLSTISVTDFSVVEGNAGTPPKLAFTVILSATSTSAVTVSYATADGTATAGSDYVATSGTLSIPPGAASAVVQVPVTPDAVIEPNETVFLNLSNATGATIFDAQGVGTIVADDGLIVSIGDKTTVEGNTGFTPVTFTVSLSAPAPGTVTVDYATADGTAAAPLDYTAATGTVTFNTGEQTKTINIQVVGETEKEAYETFFVDLSNATGGANIGDGRGQGTITNTDGATDRSRLMFHNFVTNRLYRWHMKNGNTLDTFNWVTPWATDPGWTVGAVADFDQDGQLDYLWHNVNDGRMLFWYIDGDNLKGYQFLPYQMGPPWTVATTFDADGNGTPDLAFYNSTTGVVRVMRHDNAALLGQYDLTTPLPGAGTVRVVASVDANNDGDDELALYNSATGQVLAWDVTGANVTSTINYAITQSTAQAFNLVSTKTDFNNDGLADFLWHNPTPTGVFSVWFMNGTTRLGTGVFQPFTATDPVWRVVGSANVW